MRVRQVAGLIGAIGLLVLVGVVGAQTGSDGNGGRGNGSGHGNQNGNGYRWGAGNGANFALVDPDTGEQWRQGGNIQHGAQQTMGMFSLLPPAGELELSEAAIAAMEAGLTDELTALAVYNGVIEQFGEVRPFVNIMRSEQQHADAWLFMYERYGLDVPNAPTVEVPTFATLADACQLSVDAEIANAALYDEQMSAFADYPDLAQVATALRNASEYNHLVAFQRCAG